MPLPIQFVGANSGNYMAGRQGNPINQITIHWMDGTLAGTDGWFNNPNSHVSAHYGVANGIVHQYVRDTDTAYGAGNWDVNLHTINIEHEGSPTLPIDPQTYVTSSQLLIQLCRQYNIPIDRAHIRKHSEVALHPTACPGNLDIDKLVNMAQNPIAVPPPTPPAYIVKVIVPALRLRLDPDTTSKVLGLLPLGTVAIADREVSGESVAGMDLWFHIPSHNAFIWSGGVQVISK